ncbi:SPOR domain-containing protein [Pseudomonas sp. EL_65y_Pfl2_R95]|uniref:SPOR domain-containing protein n=1 Tax=Pseudomonas sp. EL_65y_Pfl2_R95 TaxID=3088698 RepID=UPI0030DD12CE
MTSLHADEAFLDHYQFSHDPFAARVPGFKFFPAQRKPVLGQLHHLARYSQLLLAVTGPQGSGKTLLRQALVASTNKQAVLSVVVTQNAGEGMGVLRQVAQGLQVAQPDMQSILAQVGQLAITGQEVYVLVDDAEQLSDSDLRNLVTLAAGGPEGRPHVFLFAETAMLPRFDQVSDGEEHFHIIELEPYTEEDMREYLALRLEGAAQGLEIFNEEQLASIYEQSEGWPGAINLAAREVLVEAMQAKRAAGKTSGFAFNIPRKHMLALAVVVVGVLVAWMMQGRDKPAMPEGQAQAPAENVQPQAPATEQATDTAQQGTDPAEPAIEFAGSDQPMPLPLVGKSQPVIRDGEVSNNQAPAEAAPAEPESEPASDTATTPAPDTNSRLLVDTRKQVPAEEPVTPVKAPEATKPAAKPETATPAAKPANITGWYADQAGSRYTLQVVGTSSESNAKAFVSQNGSEYHYFMKMYKGKPLYVVTYGSFASADAAKAAISKMPAKVQAGKPWPRTYASIKLEIAQAR